MLLSSPGSRLLDLNFYDAPVLKSLQAGELLLWLYPSALMNFRFSTLEEVIYNKLCSLEECWHCVHTF